MRAFTLVLFLLLAAPAAGAQGLGAPAPEAGTSGHGVGAAHIAHSTPRCLRPPAPPRRPLPAVPKGVTHSARSGDTLANLAYRYSVAVEEIQRLNGLGASTTLTRGQHLRIR